MDGATWPQALPLIERLRKDPEGFDFFQFVRRLDALCKEPLGTAKDPAREPVRFGQLPTLAFTGSSIAGVEEGDRIDTPAGGDRLPPRILVNFFGLLGTNGALPTHITRYVMDRMQHKGDRTLGRFLDLFHHRAICLFYRAWAQSRIAVAHDRPANDRYRRYLGSVIGIGDEGFQSRDSVPDDAKMFYAARLAGPARNPEGLAAILNEFFDIPAEVQTFVGRWITIPPAMVNRLGVSSTLGSLGSTIILGDRVWDCQQHFRIRLGPMGYAIYQSFLPGSKAAVSNERRRPPGVSRLRRLMDWVHNYIGDELSWDLQLCLMAEERPQVQLGGCGRLGWDTWITSGPIRRPLDDLVLDPLVCSIV